MRKFVIALVAAITVGAALPAAAQVGFYAGPGGIGVGVGPATTATMAARTTITATSTTGTTDIMGSTVEKKRASPLRARSRFCPT